MNSQRENIIRKQLEKKIKKLAELESKQQISDDKYDDDDFKISRTVVACIGGFIIYRTFSRTKFTPFTLRIVPERIEVAVKKVLPIEIEDGQLYNLFELLKNSIGIHLGIGTKLDIGSRGGGISIGNGIKFGGFQFLAFNYTEIEEIAETLDDINFAVYNENEFQELKKENLELKHQVELLSKVGKPMIITEGKTDWKYFLRALKYFHSQEQFLNIDEDWFLRFGSDQDCETSNCGTIFNFENSVSKLNAILDSIIDSRKIDSHVPKWIRIGIFDSDDKQAKFKEDFQNKVYSIFIEPENISTELLFSLDEIKTISSGKRLYVGDEFDTKTGQLISDRKISIGNDNNSRNKAGKNVIIDSNVYDQQGLNIALSKDEFSRKIYNDEIIISSNSWEKFEHAFLKISRYVTN